MTCTGCGKPITKRSRTGKCHPCAMRDPAKKHKEKATKLAGVPEHLWDEYKRLTRGKRIPTGEARAILQNA